MYVCMYVCMFMMTTVWRITVKIIRTVFCFTLYEYGENGINTCKHFLQVPVGLALAGFLQFHLCQFAGVALVLYILCILLVDGFLPHDACYASVVYAVIICLSVRLSIRPVCHKSELCEDG